MRRLLSAFAVLLLSCVCSFAQKWSVGTNLVDYVNVGTLNIEAGVGVGQHLSLTAQARYNPWMFRYGTADQFQNKKQSYAVGLRWWPWHVFSGWWFSAEGQYQEYNRGGFVFGSTAEEGDAGGLVLSGGYTLMLHKFLNVEFGAGIWGGRKWYTEYACTRCGRIMDSGSSWFFLPDELKVSLVFIF